MTGFETLFATIGNQITSKNDVLVSVIHWLIIQNGYKCIGIGENFPQEIDPSSGSELLPSDWNTNQEIYILRYVKEKKKLLMKLVKAADVLIVSSLVISKENSDASVTLNSNEYITDDFRDFKKAFISDAIERISEIFRREIIPERSNASVQTENTRSDNTRAQKQERDPLQIGEPRYPTNYPRYDWEDDGGRWPAPPIGGADLDPLGRGSGGMLMDPRQYPRPFPGRNPSAGLSRPLPPGAVPPGARFDPFGPPVPGPRGPGNMPRNPQFGAPNPDHLPPPGYDDMFM